MPNIDFNEYQKSVNPPEDSDKAVSAKMLKVTDTQYFLKEEGVLFDFIDLSFGGTLGSEIGIEVWMSFLGEGFKMRCDIVPKKEFDTYDISDYLSHLLSVYLPCLECKSKFLDNLCNEERDEGPEIEFIPEDDGDDDKEEEI